MLNGTNHQFVSFFIKKNNNDYYTSHYKYYAQFCSYFLEIVNKSSKINCYNSKIVVWK
jgi:IS1 family transposase